MKCAPCNLTARAEFSIKLINQIWLSFYPKSLPSFFDSEKHANACFLHACFCDNYLVSDF